MVKAKRAARPKGDEPLAPAVHKFRALITPVKPAWSQDSLARELGVSQQAVSNWARGKAKPASEHAAVLERMFGIPMREWMLDEASAKKPARGKAA